MSPDLPRTLQALAYEREAQAYLRSLPPEHFMEATAQSHQREITLASFALIRAARPEMQYFNELLVQYPRKRRRRPGQVVPDNMVVLTTQPIRARSSYNVPLEPVPPFWVLEYVSKESERKDYEDSFKKYERELKVPYYLTFYPDNQEMTLYHHNGSKYVSVKPSDHGRCALPELELEMGLLDGWVRYWFRGELLPLPAELQSDLDRARRRADELQHKLEAAEQELAELRARLKQQGPAS